MTDEEIKNFIDSRDVLTVQELYRFVFPDQKTKYGKIEGKLVRWWEYVLKTKDWKLLREYREKKINEGNFNHKNFNKYKDIHEKDTRVRESGTRRTQAILREVYDLKLARSVISSYKRKLNGQ